MRFSEIERSIMANFARGNRIVPLIIGKPGGGKSALARKIRDNLGVLPEHVTEFNPSLRDPVDIMGTPSNEGDYTEWKPPIEFYRLREIPDDDRPRLLIVEELTDATVMMQNPMCRVLLDHHAGELQLHHNLFIVCTGNATEHNSGAQRMTTKLGGRVQQLQYDENLDDWTTWAYKNGIQQTIISFLERMPNYLSLFDPQKSINATPRTWDLANQVDPDLPADLYQMNVAAFVGPGPAAEFVAFKRLEGQLPSIKDVLADPDNYPIPDENNPDIRYAFAGMLAAYATSENLGDMVRVLKRMPPDMSVLVMTMATKRDSKLRDSRAFIEWSLQYNSVLA